MHCPDDLNTTSLSQGRVLAAASDGMYTPRTGEGPYFRCSLRSTSSHVLSVASSNTSVVQYPALLSRPFPGAEELNKHIAEVSVSSLQPLLWGFPMTQLSGFGSLELTSH